MKDSVWPTVWEFACGCMLVALAALALFGLTSCAAAPPRTVVVPHVCDPIGDSVNYQRCVADCPDGDAFIVENHRDVSCVCRKPHDAL